MALSPLSLYYWASLAMEPWAPPRSEILKKSPRSCLPAPCSLLLAPCPSPHPTPSPGMLPASCWPQSTTASEVRTFVKVLSNGYESLKLGRHASGTKSLRDGVLKVGPKMAGKLNAKPVTDAWFSAIGDCPNSELLRLYSKVGAIRIVLLETRRGRIILPIIPKRIPRCSVYRK